MSRTKLADRKLPGYSQGEELANTLTHIVGAAFGIVALVLCIIYPLRNHNFFALTGGIVYSFSIIFLYTASSLYHGLTAEMPKKVMQVIDHCTIFALILGSYVPIMLTGVREYSLILFIVISVLLVAGTAVCVTFTAIDFKTYAKVSMTGYLAIGWAAILILYPLYKIYGFEIIIWLFTGGLAYTIGVIFYAKGAKKRYFHSIFHLFILLGTALHFVGIFKFCIVQ